MDTTWLNPTEYPFVPHYAMINGYPLHYIDEGKVPLLLFVHGTPSWSFNWRNVIKALRGSYRRVAIDHIEFENRFQRHGPLAFARSLVSDQSWFEELWHNRIAIAHRPMLLIWGMRDPILEPHYLKKLADNFPNATVRPLANGGYFPQEEEPERVARFMDDWLAHEPVVSS